MNLEETLEGLRSRLLDDRAVEDGIPLAEAAAMVVDREVPMLPARLRFDLVARLVADASGFGPLEPLLRDRTVDEIMVNGPGDVWIERNGRLERSGVRFQSREALRDAIDRLLASGGRRADELSPLADARLPDGSRVNVALPPLAVDGPVLTVRRFRDGGFALGDLVAGGTLGDDLARLLGAAVVDRLNILVSGATGSGKTTTLAALAREIPACERIVTIEDAAELALAHPHVVRLEARPAGPGGGGAVTIRDLVRNALRMRPDRMVVGEVRGGEALDMLEAMATGHAGSLTTVHASSPVGALRRLEGLAHQARSGLTNEGLRERISSAIDVVVHQVRAADGSRVVDRVAVVEPASDRLDAAVVYRLEQGRGRWRVAGSPLARRGLRLG